MDDSVFERLEQAYEKGLKGTVDSLSLWLEKLGIDSKQLTVPALVGLLQSKPELTIDREEELSSIVEFIGFYKRQRNGIFHLPMIGVRGIGKSHLMSVISHFLKMREKNLQWKFIDASLFTLVTEDQEENQRYLSFLDELKSNQYEILLVDSCEKDKNIDEALRGVSRYFSKGVLITSWLPYKWDYLKDRIEEFFPPSKEIYINPLDEDSTHKFLSAVLGFISRDKYELKTQLARLFHEYSDGIPGNILSLMVRSFQEAFNMKKNDLDEDTVKAAARSLFLEGAKQTISKLADHQLLILKHLLLEADQRGTRPSKLVEILGKDKATISYHLSELSKLRLLVSERIGRWVFYRVRDELVPLVGLRLTEESDFLA
jgi:DNA-binding transcriptional ArsR family regulator